MLTVTGDLLDTDSHGRPIVRYRQSRETCCYILTVTGKLLDTDNHGRPVRY